MADTSRSMPTVARLYTQNGYRRASVKPGRGRALVLREDAKREAREAYAAGVHAGRAEHGANSQEILSGSEVPRG